MARGHGKKSGKGREAKAPSWRDVWKVIANSADGSCGLYAIMQLLLVKKRGMSASEAERVFRRAAGTQEMCELLMACRGRVVEYGLNSPLFASSFTDGEDDDGEADGDADGGTGSNNSTTGELKSLEQWTKAILDEGSYIDGTAIFILGHIFGMPDVRIVRKVSGGGLVDKFEPNKAVESTDNLPSVLWTERKSGNHHFEAMVPIAHDAGTKVSAGNDLGSVMEFCRQALHRPADDPADAPTDAPADDPADDPVDDPVDEEAFVATVIEFVRRIPRRTGPVKKVHKTHGTRKWTRGRTPLTRGRVSRFRDICRGLRSIRGGGDGDDSGTHLSGGTPTAPVAPVDAGLPPAAPEGWDNMQPQVAPTAPVAPVDAGLPPVAPGGWDDMQPQVAHGASGLVRGGANQGGGKVCVRWFLC